MSPEPIAIIGAVMALAAVILPGRRAMRRNIAGVHHDIADLRERMARLAGTVQALSLILVDRERHAATP